MQLIGDVKAYDLLDHVTKTTLYQCRIRPYKIVHAMDATYPKAYYIKEFNRTLSYLLHNRFIEFGENKST